MRWESERSRAEWALDVAAAASFAGAVAFAYAALAVEADAAAAVTGAAAFLVAITVLGWVPVGERTYPLPQFTSAPIETVEEADGEAGAELLLHDRLAAVDADARVVQLFGPNRQPTVPTDASQALIDALLELRRSFR